MELHNLIICSNIVEIKKYLIKNPEAINKIYTGTCYKYQTQLLCAVEYSNAKTVKLLLDYGADTNMYVPNRYYPLIRSINSKDNLKKIKLLLMSCVKYGANPHLKSIYDSGPIVYAIYCNSYKAILILLEYDVNYDGNSMYVIRFVEKIKLLNIKN